MINKEGSKGIDINGDAYDYGFTIEIGRVHYSLNEDGTYTTELRLHSDAGAPVFETRTMSFQALNDWYSNPTPEYYEEAIKDLPKD